MKSINKVLLSTAIALSLSLPAKALDTLNSASGGYASASPGSSVGASNAGAGMYASSGNTAAATSSQVWVDPNQINLNAGMVNIPGATPVASLNLNAGGNGAAQLGVTNSAGTSTAIVVQDAQVSLVSTSNSGQAGNVRLTGVANGVFNSDAVNLGQMNAAITAGAGTDTTARNSAAAAQTSANAAATTATAASTAAANSQFTADQAMTKATTASNQALTAQSIGNNATVIADRAQTTADTAQATATAAQTTANGFSSRISALQDNLNKMEADLNKVDIDAQRGIASLASINNAPIPSAVGNFTIAVGAGQYKSQSATGLSFAYRGGEMTYGAIITGGVGYSGGGDPVYKIGAAWEL